MANSIFINSTTQKMKSLPLDPETTHEIKGLQSLLLSGIKENIVTVWQICEGLKIPENLILDCYKEIFELLKKFKKISSKKLNKDAFFEITNLESLDLSGNSIADATPFSALTNLKSLDLSGNGITHASAFSALKNLEYLDLSGNGITDASAFSALKNLEYLDLSGNGITDSSAFSALTNLEYLDCYL